MADFKYLQDRGGRIHVWNGCSPSKTDPWLRAACGDPGDFMELQRVFRNGEYLKYKGPITCKGCMKALNMPIQLPLFKTKEE